LLKTVTKDLFTLSDRNFGNWWQDKNGEFYSSIYKNNPKIHMTFREWLTTKNDIKTVLEVGCGDGIYGRSIFTDKIYHGIDIGETAIAIAKSQDESSHHSYNCNDFIKDIQYEDDSKYDLVFSHSVVDHVYDIDAFITKCIKNAKKYVYITAYFGYHPQLQSHEMTWRSDITCYRNKLSVPKLRELLNSMNLKYTIKSLDRGPNNIPQFSTIIIIQK